MKQITSESDIADLGTVLVVGAHPDDETFMAAGIMACAVRQGQVVACATATKGEAGSQDLEKWPPEKLADVRSKELAEAMHVIGVNNHYWFNYADGGCEEVLVEEAVAKIESVIEKFQPDSILTFGLEGMTGHPDHMCVSRWASQAAANVTKQPRIFHAVNTTEQYERYLKAVDEKLNIFFNIDKPPLVEPKDCAILFELPPEIRELKRKALAAMPSQTEIMLKLFPPAYLDQGFSPEAFVLA
jgi:LmbE family N-acetylglucosaminyl deacetylase